jgi:hypothetical protein
MGRVLKSNAAGLAWDIAFNTLFYGQRLSSIRPVFL